MVAADGGCGCLANAVTSAALWMLRRVREPYVQQMVVMFLCGLTALGTAVVAWG